MPLLFAFLQIQQPESLNRAFETELPVTEQTCSCYLVVRPRDVFAWHGSHICSYTAHRHNHSFLNFNEVCKVRYGTETLHIKTTLRLKTPTAIQVYSFNGESVLFKYVKCIT